MDWEQNESLLDAALGVVRRAQQQGGKDRVLAVHLDSGGLFPAMVAVTEGISIPLSKMSLQMRVAQQKLICADFDRSSLQPYETLPDYQVEAVCFDLDTGWAYATNWSDRKVWLPSELYLRAEAAELYFVACVTRRYKPEVHFAYTDDPSLRIMLDRYMSENLLRMRKEEEENG